MASTDFSITFQSEDSDFAFDESKYIRKRLQEEQLEHVKIAQNRKKLENDEAGGLLLAGIVASVSTTAVLGAAGSLASILDLILNIYLLRKKKNETLDKKPLKLHFESPSGSKFSIDIDALKDKEEIIELVSSLKAAMDEE